MMTETDFYGFREYAKRLWNVEFNTKTALVSYELEATCFLTESRYRAQRKIVPNAIISRK